MNQPDVLKRIEQLEANAAKSVAVIALLEKRVAELENNNPERNMPEECRKHRCSYFTHYLAYGGPDLTHEGFHAAEKICEGLQTRVEDWYKAHKEGQLPESLERLCHAAEARVRA